MDCMLENCASLSKNMNKLQSKRI